MINSRSRSSGRILVTGSTGFVGRQMIAKLVQSQLNPVAWARSSVGSGTLPFDQDIEIQVGSLSEAGDFIRKNPDIVAVIHLAAVVAPKHRSTAFETNVDLTCKLASEISKRTSPPVFIYVSSLAAGGPSPESHKRKESELAAPKSIYGESKLAAERALLKFADAVPISIVRPPGVFGPSDRNLFQLFRTVRAGWNFVGISKRFQYSFVHVDDLTSGILSVLERGKRLSVAESDSKSVEGSIQSNATSGSTNSSSVGSEGLYYIADPQPVTFVELADMVADAMGTRRPRHVTLPACACWPLALASEVGGRCLNVKTFLNIDKMREAVAGNWTCDTSKAASELEFTVAADLNQRVSETGKWYSENGWL